MRLPWLAIVPSVVAISAPLATAGPKLTLDDTISRALANPSALAAEADEDSAAARVEEADAARLPHIKVTAFATVSPKINCGPADCTQTDPTQFGFNYSGFYGDAELSITQPVYTFGKISHARNAARAGVAAEAALADETAGNLAVDAARAYWGVKVARELTGELDDGIDQIQSASKQFKEAGNSTIIDRQRVAVLLAEAKAQRADAAQQERAALAGLRAITGIADADVDDALVEAVKADLPDDAAVGAVGERRPQAIAARQGATAADELADFQHSQLFPDFALIGGAVASKATGVAEPESAFMNNPYNRVGVGLVFGMSWTLEPWNVTAREDRARADAKKAHELAELARIGARYDLEGALAEVNGARDKLAARTEGEKAAQTWLAAVLQAQAIGTAQPKDLADSFIAFFQNRAQWGAAVFEWNVAVVRLHRAMGEFRAGHGATR